MINTLVSNVWGKVNSSLCGEPQEAFISSSSLEYEVTVNRIMRSILRLPKELRHDTSNF